MLTLYAAKDNSDNVLIFKDREQTQHVCTFGAWRTDKPDRRYKYLNYNCYRWKIEWVEII